MPVPAHPSSTYATAALALRQMVGDDMPPINSPFSPANARSLGILGIRSSVRRMDEGVTPVVIFTLDENVYPNSEDVATSGPLATFGQAGIQLPGGEVKILVEFIGGMQRIPPAVGASRRVPLTGLGGRSQGSRQPTSADVAPTVGEAISTIVAPLDGERLFTVGGTLGGLVRLTTGQRQAIALVSCSHCIALSDPADGLPPAVGDLVFPMRRSSSVLATQDPRPLATAALERWSTLSDEVDVALATLLDEASVTPPADPYLCPLDEAQAIVGEVVWMVGAGTGRVSTGLVDSIDAIAYVLNPDGSPTWYRNLVTIGRPTRDGWAPVTSPGDSGAWVLGWRGGHVAVVGMAALTGVPSGRRRSHAFTMAYRMDAVLRQLRRTHSVDGRNGVEQLAAIDEISVDGRHAHRALPRPAWLSADATATGLPPPQETAMDQPHCVTFNLHFHPPGPGVPTDAKERPRGRADRTGFTYFRNFRISAGSLNHPSGRPIRRVTVTRRNVPNAGGAAVQVFDYAGNDAAAIASGRAAIYRFANSGESQPKQIVIEVVEGPSAADPNPRTTMCEVNLAPGIPGFLGEVELELASVTGNWRAHYSYAYELTDFATIRETIQPLDFP